MIYSLLYELILIFLAILTSPKIIYQMLVHKKYRNSFLQRLGIDFPEIDKGKRQLIWIHAVSVGETKAVALLAKRLKNELNNPILVISSITETGHAEAKRTIPFADYHVYLPFDFYFIIKPILRKSRPDLVILCETDFWFNFMRLAKNNGAMIALVNGKISINSASWFSRFSFLTEKLFSLIDLYCLQSIHYKERFLEIGIPKQELFVTGNLKFDEKPEMLTVPEKNEFKSKLGIQSEDIVLVIGSTHDPEEKALLTELEKVWGLIPHLKVIIVPRHPERFDTVASILDSKKIHYARYSRADNEIHNKKVILLDTMGVLRKCYQIADAAIVAGSYTPKVGGHNILEPLWYGVPLLFGPYMHSQPALVEIVKEYGAGWQVPLENIEKAIEDIFIMKRGEELKLAGLKLTSETGGSTARTFDLLINKMPLKVPQR